jgi:desumoylating isopeptidase 1
MTTNPASMNALLRTHRAVVAFFTSATCGPCRMIEPAFERLAEEKTQGRSSGAVAFTKIDMGVGMGGTVANEWRVRVTPTFIFFLDGKNVGCSYELPRVY